MTTFEIHTNTLYQPHVRICANAQTDAREYIFDTFTLQPGATRASAGAPTAGEASTAGLDPSKKRFHAQMGSRLRRPARLWNTKG